MELSAWLGRTDMRMPIISINGVTFARCGLCGLGSTLRAAILSAWCSGPHSYFCSRAFDNQDAGSKSSATIE
jgi:hypothetical protein